ncbi:MAG: cupin domain-containing protein [Alphaproteobacteria bacterium]
MDENEDHVTVAQAKSAPLSPGRRSSLLMQRGSMSLRWFAPRGEDVQTPHDQDEIYIVMNGSGILNNGGAQTVFGPGDVLFVPAGREHKFESFSDNLDLWVVFWGPKGGEEILAEQ